MLQISEFGLVEITRQRSRNNLERVLTRSCPDCSGTGRVKTDLTAALDLRRALLRPPVLYASGDAVSVRAPSSLAEFFREDGRILEELRTTLGIRLEVVPDDTLAPGDFQIVLG